MRPKLVYIGKQEWPGHEPMQLWNIYNSPCPDKHPDGSTISLESLKEMRMVKWF